MGSVKSLCMLVGTIVLFAFSGLVPVEDTLFSLFMVTYIITLSQVALPNRQGLTLQEALDWGPHLDLIQTYITVTVVLGFLLPLAYAAGAYACDDLAAIAAATPPFSLLLCQVLFEMHAGEARFSRPAHALVAIFFNARRITTIYQWCQVEMARGIPDNPELSLYLNMLLWSGRFLAVVNMALWAFNFFCFLIPIYLPMAFSRYDTAPLSSISLQPPSSADEIVDTIAGKGPLPAEEAETSELPKEEDTNKKLN